MDDYIHNNLATIHDLELITGLRFFPDLTKDQQARIKTQLNTVF